MKKRIFIDILVVFFIFIIDLITKHYVFSYFGNRIIIKNFLNITLTTNKGIAFGLFAEFPFLSIICFVVIILFILYILFSPNSFFLRRWTFVLILGGAIGNLYDRLKYGYVRDFIDFHIGDIFHWPVFNFADIFITIGFLLFFINLSFKEKSND